MGGKWNIWTQEGGNDRRGGKTAYQEAALFIFSKFIIMIQLTRM
jgi:hypothetical protein